MGRRRQGARGGRAAVGGQCQDGVELAQAPDGARLGLVGGAALSWGGRKAKLSSEQKQALYALVVSGPQANGFDCGVWTSAMLSTQSLKVMKIDSFSIL